MKKQIIFVFVAVALGMNFSNRPMESSFKIARLKYGGGGDWYANKATSIPNLIQFINQNTAMKIENPEDIVEAGSPNIFQYPFIHMSGHGNVKFTDAEAENLRKYLMGGGFLHADDNYGMDKFFRREIKKVFPEYDLVEVPFSHPIYHEQYEFPKGLPKIHEHDGKPAQGFGIFHEGRLVVFYSYECDLGNGWENPEIYGDPQEKHVAAMQMGTNLILYAIQN